jgi:hypothetical protein
MHLLNFRNQINMAGIKFLSTALLFSLVAAACSKDKVLSDRIDGGAGGIIGAVSGGGLGGDSTLDAGKVTAGEWNDLSNWGFWEGILAKPDFEKLPDYWGFNTSIRIAVQVKNDQGFVMVDEPLILTDASGVTVAETRTDNKGMADFFPVLKAGNNSTTLEGITIKANNQTFTALKKFTTGINELIINKTAQIPPIADIAFVVDATSSMGDEISYLKTELDDVIRRVRNNYSTLTVNTAAVFYRDEGDDYITKSQPFSNNFQPVLDFIKNQAADGGGDFPEAVHSALKAGIHDLNWSTNARARILFLLLDAPPHYEPGIINDLHTYIKEAAKKGIKIIPITASGIDKETEFLMRYFSIKTNGTYVFITNHSGIGDNHLEASVGQYEVEYLNNLMVRLIGKYLQ